MRIVYMGTPDFAVPPLIRLKEEGHDISMVITQPDKPRDRGKKILPPPVKVQAESYGIQVCQPQSNKEILELISNLKIISPDIIIVAAYGRLLPVELLELPRLGCVNIHASLLPKYRGAAPIPHAILSSDTETGVTLMYMSEGMDEWDIIIKKPTPIGDKTAGQLFCELSVLGAELLIETLPSIIDGTADRIVQNRELATYAPKITKEDSRLDFRQTAEAIERRIRAMDPKPGAYTFIQGMQVKMFDAEIISHVSSGPPGFIQRVDKYGILVSAGEGDLLIKRIKAPGKQTMDVSEYIKGNKIEIGSVLS